MGRKAKFADEQNKKKGPGRKAKKQEAPVAPFQAEEKTNKSKEEIM